MFSRGSLWVTVCLALSAPVFPQSITTVAGNGNGGFSGDGGAAIAASLNHPRGVAVDASGAVFISDLDNRRIRRIGPEGTISTYAGNGFTGSGGDGGPAGSASLSDVSSIVLDAAGNLYIGDASNRKVRKISPAGIITTIAGTGTEGFSGDGGPATSAMLGRPHDLAVDASGAIYIADSVNHRIRKIFPNGIIATFAGTGFPGFSGDGGPATAAALNFPVGVAVDAFGNVYVADGDNNRIRRIAPGGIISTVAGRGTGGFDGDGGLAVNASINIPSDVVVDGTGAIYIADAGNNRVRKVDASGTITTIAGTGTDGFSGDGGPAVQAQLNFPWGLGLDPSGAVYIADRVNHRIRKIASTVTIGPPSISSVVNGASFSSTMSIAPGAIVTIFGTNLASTTASAQSTPLPTSLAGTSVRFNGRPVPLFFVSAGQINLQVPFDLPTGTAVVQVLAGSQSSGFVVANVTPASPGVFIIDQTSGAGAFVNVTSGQIVSTTAPVRPGDTLMVFATGLGPLNIQATSGAPAPLTPPFAETLIAPTVTIGGFPAAVVFSGLAPGFIGLYQLNVQVPANVAPGSQSVRIQSNGLTSNTAMIAIVR